MSHIISGLVLKSMQIKFSAIHFPLQHGSKNILN